MISKTPELTCQACKKRVALGTMRYSKDGSGLICESCVQKSSGKINLKSSIQEVSLPKSNNVKHGKKVEFYCKNCSFKWSRAIDFRGPKLCPSCGRDTVMYNLPNDADELLRELDRMDDV